MAAYPSLSLNFDIRSELSATPRLRRLRFGDGYIARIAAGVNNIDKVYIIVQKVKTQAEAYTLRTYLEDHAGGESTTIPLLNEDPTGATTSNFYIQGWSDSFSDSEVLPTFTIVAEEL